jgi:hypothetical protein
MTTKKKAAGLRTRTAHDELLHPHLTGRLGETKRLLTWAYHAEALTLPEAERIASRLRRRYGRAWRSA